MPRWVEDKVNHYRLTKEIVEEVLLGLFPNVSEARQFGVKEELDVFKFKVPNGLLTSVGVPNPSDMFLADLWKAQKEEIYDNKLPSPDNSDDDD